MTVRLPNNPALPFVRYRGAVALCRRGRVRPRCSKQLFEANGWGGSWRNGIYDYVHYHPRTLEVLAGHRQRRGAGASSGAKGRVKIAAEGGRRRRDPSGGHRS